MFVLASTDELPPTFRDPRCNDFITACSNGFEGGVCIASAPSHNPRTYPQCYRNGPDQDCTCEVVLLRRVDSPAKS